MNILILNYEYPPIGGGAAPVSKDLATELASNGHAVSVLTMKYGDAPDVINEDGVTVHRLKCIRRKKASCSPIEQLSYLIAVRKYMKNHKELQNYDVCHAHFVIPTAEVAKYIKRKYGIPYIITAHGSDVEGHNTKKTVMLMHRVLRYSWRRIVSEAFCVVSPSMYLLDRMKRNYSGGKYVFCPNGIDYELFSGLKDNTKKEKRILVMGRIQKFKNVQFIISAFSKIIGYEDWKIDLVGDGPYRKEIEMMIENLKLEDRVCMVGWLDNKSEQLLERLKTASIYVSASQFENCPMSVIESATAGCYPLVSDIPAHRQLLSEEYLFSIDSEQELIDKMVERMSIGRCSYKIDMKKYDWKVITNQYEDVMRSALKEKGK